MDNIASRIISLRGKLSRRPFAEKIGTTESTLRNYEKGVSLPDAQILKNICQILQISPEWLLLGVGPMNISEQKNVDPAQNVNQIECQRCMRLENELALERQERRELAQENRQLLRENGDLRAQVARLEERKNRLAIVSEQPVANSGVA